MKKIWMKKSGSFREAEEFDQEYYLKMTPEERIDTMQFLREIYYKFGKEKKRKGRTRIQKVIKIIKQESTESTAG